MIQAKLVRVSYFTTMRWPFWILLGLVLLPGRYDWSQTSAATSWRGLLCSAFLLCLVTWLLSAVLAKFASDVTWKAAIVGTVTIILSLPYRWLGLHRWYYHRDKPQWIDWSIPTTKPPAFVWLPDSPLFAGSVPAQAIFFLILIGMIVGMGWLCLVMHRKRGGSVSIATLAFGLALVTLVVSETALHLSMRSPDTYVNHFSKPAATNFWYHVFLFPDATGAVNADYFGFRAVEELFMGTPRAVNGMLTNRPLPLYLSSQLSYFLNPFYVMTAMNVLCWLAAALAVRDYVAGQFDGPIGTVAALLTASAPGFIAFVAQPPTYLWGFSAAAITIWAHWRFCCRSKSSTQDYVLFGGLLALALLTYDLFSLLTYLIGYELVFRKSFKKIALSIGIAVSIYVAFGALCRSMQTIVPDGRNVKYVTDSIQNALTTAASLPISLKTWEFWGGFLSGYLHNLAHAFFIFPLALAIAGIFLLKDMRELRLIGLLALPSAVNFGLLYLGQTELAGMPRFQFIGYTAVYILCGVLAVRLGEFTRNYRYWAVPAFATAAVSLNVVLANADIFGHPWMYFLFFFPSSWANF